MSWPRAGRLIPVAVLCPILLCAACSTSIPKEALQLGPESLANRQLQTRLYDTHDEGAILAASAGVLQDLGFTIEESETRLGVIVASKDRSAVEAGQVVLAVAATLLFHEPVAYDRVQKIRVSLVSRPYGETGKRTAVRVTFQRIVWNNENDVTRQEALDDPDLYQQFFAKLSKAVFLEAHEI